MPLPEAFPHLAGQPLLDPAVLAAQRALAAQRGRVRAAERVAPVPAALAPADAERLRAARLATIDAEDRADAADARLIAALEAGLERAPGLGEAPLEALRAELRARRASATRALDAAAEPSEARDHALAAVARAAETEATLDRLRAAALRAMSIPGDDALGREALALAARVEAGDGALDTEIGGRLLSAASPLADGEVAAAITRAVRGEELRRLAALEAELSAQMAAPEAATAEDPGAPEAVEAALADAAARRDALAAPEPTGDVELSAARARVASLRRALLDAEVRRWEARLGHARELGAARTATVQADAEAARRDAEAARSRSEGGASAEATIREATAEVLEEESVRHEAAAARLSALRVELEGRVAAAREAVALPPLESARRGRIDAAYLDIRASVRALRAEITDLRGAWQRLEADAQARYAAPSTAVGPLPTPEVLDARDAFERALASRSANVRSELADALDLLGEAKVARRATRGEASAEARTLARRTFLPELGEELREVPLVLRMQASSAGDVLSAARARLFDVTAWWAVLFGSMEILAVGAGWRWLRARAPATVGLAAAQGARDSELRTLGDLQALVPAGSALALAALDGLVFLIAVAWLGRGYPGLALLPWIGVAWAVVRGASALVDLLLATPDEARPALRVTDADTRELVRTSVRWLVIWYWAKTLARWLALELLDADRIAEVIGTLGTLAAAAVLAALLVRWAPVLRRSLASGESAAGADRLLARWQGGAASGWRAVPFAAAAVALLGARAVSGFARGGVRPMEWLGLAWERRRLNRGALAEPTEPDAEVTRALLAGALSPPRVEELQGLRAAFATWQRERRRGLVGIVGDAGSGRSALLEAFLSDLPLPVARVPLPARLTDPERALALVAEHMGLPAIHHEAALCVALETLPPHVIALDDLHRLFLRSVGGYDALRAVLSVAQATAGAHFWVTSAHVGAWDVMRGMPQRVPLGGFRTVLRLPPIPEAALRDWLGQGVRNAGFTLDFDGLYPADADRPTRLRSEAAWFRMIADASGGEPGVALAELAVAVRPDAGGPRGLRAVPLVAQPSAEIENLGDDAHFALAAIFIHRRLDVASLALVLNLPGATVRAVCLDLQGRGIVSGDAASLALEPRWVPAVRRVLGQRHFLEDGK